MSAATEKAIEAIKDHYTAACQMLDAAESCYAVNSHRVDDGDRATALAALATARFARVSAAANLLGVAKATS